MRRVTREANLDLIHNQMRVVFKDVHLVEMNFQRIGALIFSLVIVIFKQSFPKYVDGQSWTDV